MFRFVNQHSAEEPPYSMGKMFGTVPPNTGVWKFSNSKLLYSNSFLFSLLKKLCSDTNFLSELPKCPIVMRERVSIIKT